MVGDHSLKLPTLAERGHFGGVMKTKLLRLLSVIGLILAAVASLDITGITAVLPPEYSGKALAAGLIAAALKELIFAIGDLADDGVRNSSWHPIIAWMLLPAFLFLPSCLTSHTITTLPDGTKVEQTTRASDSAGINAGANAAANAALLLSQLRGGK
jgi:hypothetical protein